MTNKTFEVLWQELETLDFQHNEILDIIRAANLDLQLRFKDLAFEIGEADNRANFLLRATIKVGDEKGKIKDWQVGPAFTPAVFDEVLKLAKELRAPKVQSHILSRIMFSQRELLGSWKYGDHFQILPCLDDIRVGKGLDWYDHGISRGRNESYRGPPFPFLVEVSVPKISNDWLQNQIGMKLLERFEHLLCTFVVGVSNTMLWPKDRQWTALKSIEDGGIDYHLLHSGIGTQRGGRTDTWTEWLEKRAPLFDGLDYDDSLKPNQVDELVLPPDLEQIFDSYFSLRSDLRRDFDRSAYFFTVGQKLRNNHDLAIMNFAIAIECLLDSEKAAKCSTCGHVPGSTKRFKEFLERHAPVSETLIERRNKLYAMRSMIAHGSRSMVSDINIFSLASDEETPMLMDWLARKSLKSWLRESGKATF